MFTASMSQNKRSTGLLIATIFMLLGSISLSMACSADEAAAPAVAPAVAPTAASVAAPAQPAPTVALEEKADKQIAFPVFASTSIVGDWVKNVGGERVIVEHLAPAGKDPHTYQPTPKEVAKLSESKLVFSIGLSLEGKNISSLLENSLSPDATHIPLGPLVNPIEYGEHDEHDEQDEQDEQDKEEQQAHGTHDPHFWLDPSRASLAIDEITTQLSVIDPDSADFYQENATAYKSQLSDLDKQMSSVFEQIPEKDRKLVTSHEALGYLAHKYDFEIVGTVIPSMSTESGPAAIAIAKLVDDLKTEGVKGIFMESGIEEKITKQIAQDANVEVITGLQVEYVLEGETYLQMMTKLSELIVEGLK